YKLPSAVTVLIGAAYILYPALSGGCLYDLHENCFLSLTLLFIIWAVETGHTKTAVVFAVATWCIKEDAGIQTAFLGLYFLASGKHKKEGSLLFLFSCAAFFITTSLVAESGYEVMSQRFSNLVTSDSKDLLSVVTSAFTHAAYFFSECITGEKILYLALMLMPFAMVIFAKKDPTSFILMGPMILLNVLPDYAYMYTINYQYNFGNAALLFYFFILAICDANARSMLKAASAAAAVYLVLFCGTKLSRLSVVSDYFDDRAKYETMENAIESIPKDASVTASTYLVAHLYEHERLYPTSSRIYSDYLVLDLTRDTTEAEQTMLDSGKYEIWTTCEGSLAIYELK
ncbi:MAG: DUF2079 domain-containing protein, partial [Firmicutes bacterium]|nr:DUF2079 domain-containing protein [Bacillota bacterium]